MDAPAWEVPLIKSSCCTWDHEMRVNWDLCHSDKSASMTHRITDEPASFAARLHHCSIIVFATLIDCMALGCLLIQSATAVTAAFRWSANIYRFTVSGQLIALPEAPFFKPLRCSWASANSSYQTLNTAIGRPTVEWAVSFCMYVVPLVFGYRHELLAAQHSIIISSRVVK